MFYLECGWISYYLHIAATKFWCNASALDDDFHELEMDLCAINDRSYEVQVTVSALDDHFHELEVDLCALNDGS